MVQQHADLHLEKGFSRLSECSEKKKETHLGDLQEYANLQKVIDELQPGWVVQTLPTHIRSY